ncbi:MAG: ParA family protein [Egibacteraceae bacterium]
MTTTIALFNNKGGVGKTTLAYHLAHMVARLGWRVLAADLDPQANLTAAFFDEEQLELLWDDDEADTIVAAVEPLMRGIGDVKIPDPREAADFLWVLPGDLGLSRFEDHLSDAWPRSYEGAERAVRVATAFHRILQGCATKVGASVVFIDVGPNLGAINRSALLASDALLVPLAADLFSLQGLKNLGPTLRQWRKNWEHFVLPHAPADVPIPAGVMRPLGYVVLQHAVRLDRPVRAYDRWLRRIPEEFHRSVLGEPDEAVTPQSDPYQLASLRNYRSLMPLAQDARKPMFDLKPADGALGSTGRLVQTCYRDFEQLAERLMESAGIPSPAAV